MKSLLLKLTPFFLCMLILLVALAFIEPLVVRQISTHDAHNLSREFLKKAAREQNITGALQATPNSLVHSTIMKLYSVSFHENHAEDFSHPKLSPKSNQILRSELINFERGKHLGTVEYARIDAPNGNTLFRAGTRNIAMILNQPQTDAAYEMALSTKTPQFVTSEAESGETIFTSILPLINDQGALSAIAVVNVNNSALHLMQQLVRTTSTIASAIVSILGLLAFSYIFLKSESKLARAEHKNHLAKFDKLTELYHRKGFEERIRNIEEGQSVALALMDVDNFKSFNDQFGHLVGDAVLKHVADSMREEFGDQILCRWAGDEFIVLVLDPGTKEQLSERLQRLCDFVARPLGGDNSDVKCTTSVGAHIDKWSAGDINKLIHLADAALYFAKDKPGKGQFYIYSPDLDEKRRREAQLEYRLGCALKEDAMHLVYQPQYDVKAGRMQSVEAFMRWTDAELGVVSPAEFIPVAEKAGLILELGKWVINRACREAAKWPAEIRVSANVSAVEFESPDFVEVVKNALSDSGLSPERLEIELTETALLHNNEATTKTVNDIADMGVSIAIDGFGTGNASLTYLATLPVSTIKLHRFFISKLGEDQINDAIVNATVGLAKVLDMTFVAQGIETAEQRQLMLDFGGSVMQGMFFGKPSEDPFDEHNPVQVIIDAANDKLSQSA